MVASDTSRVVKRQWQSHKELARRGKEHGNHPYRDGDLKQAIEVATGLLG
jgi:hypothetical protein